MFVEKRKKKKIALILIQPFPFNSSIGTVTNKIVIQSYEKHCGIH